MAKIENKSFFKKPLVEKSITTTNNQLSKQRRPLDQQVKNVVDTLNNLGMNSFATRLLKLYKQSTHDLFSVAVVGEFSRGKSTFINHLLNCDCLPVGNLPTTALMTRIRYAQQNKITHVDDKGVILFQGDLVPESWDNLVAGNDGSSDPNGFVAVGIGNDWLKQCNLEIIDSPGAGDLDEKRARQIGDVLLRCDGVVIAISALQPLSESECLFIQQRVIARQTPFMMLALTKMDEVKKEERNRVIEFVKNKLINWGLSIPIVIPTEVELTDDKYSDCVGVDKVRQLISSWAYDPKLRQLKDNWFKARASEVIDIAIQSLNEQQVLLDADDEKKHQAFAQKKNVLDQMDLAWGNICLELQRRQTNCYCQFVDKVDEYARDITERLQYESSHAAHPQQWWENDYPYRLKVELANMAVGLENAVTRIVTADANWFNATLERQFQTAIAIGQVNVADRNEIKTFTSSRNIKFEDVTRKQNISRIGTVAVSIAGAIALSACGLGVLSLIATMGVGTGASILSGNFFKKKLEEQRLELRNTIANDVPLIVAEATAESENRVRALYDDMLAEAKQKRNLWIEGQLQAIKEANKPQTQERRETLNNQITLLNQINKQFKQ